jgi:hypothetical protein
MIQEQNTFTFAGTVVKRWVATSGKFATLKVSNVTDGRATKMDFVSFDCVNDIATLSENDTVKVTGRMGIKKLTSKDRQDVMIDGYAAWVPQLVITKVESQKASKIPVDDGDASPTDDDQIPF